MQRFDCLSPKCSLSGPHLLEASAGTGKTFAVEQIFVRLLLESDIEVDQILAVTFTRAATRELKERIRSNIEKAIVQLQSGEIQWEYLARFCGQIPMIRKLQDALNGFDQSQIFTIHGFCHRMLREFAFEAGLRFSSQNPDRTSIQIPEKLKLGVIDFLFFLKSDLLCAEQLAILLKKYRNMEKLADALLKISMKEVQASLTFPEFYQRYRNLIGAWKLNREKVLNDFRLIAKNYKSQIKGQFEKQIESLTAEPTQEGFRFLLSEPNSVFEFLSPANRKQKYTPVSVESDSFFEWGRLHLIPMLEMAADPKGLFKTLANAWIPCVKRLMSQEELFDPDAILKKMRESLNDSSFVQRIRSKYQAAIIDEFQDTDLLQWEIFRILFLDEPVKSVFLVGDPKQSIYRFRKADIYTYLQAKDHLDPACHYYLDTNFRSSEPLIGALNTLFDREWLFLPKLKRSLPYLPVHAGAKDIETFADGKGAIHFFMGHGESNERKWLSDSLLEHVFLPFIAKEIARLKSETGSLSRFAILVKDRYQANHAVRFLQQRGLAALTKSHTPLGETFAFQSLREVLDSLIDPKDRRKARLVLAGPFSRMKSDEIPPDVPLLFFELKAILEEKGLVAFFQKFLYSRFHQMSLLEAIAAEDAHFYRDFYHVVELLLEWERSEGFSLEGLSRFLKEVSLLEAEEDEQVRRRMESDDEAIQVMTMHVSKGLEFDVVFALGLAARTPKPEEEAEEFEVEKLRQLYVAMTRAKRRLYVPIVLGAKEEDLEGTESPIELFLKIFKGEKSLDKALEEAAEQSSISSETLNPASFDPILERDSIPLKEPPPIKQNVKFSYLHSFTFLAHKEDLYCARLGCATLDSGRQSKIEGNEAPALLEERHSQFSEGDDKDRFGEIVASPNSQPHPDLFDVHTLPRGADMGILLHQLLEDIFSSSYPLWRNPREVEELVLKEMKYSKFASWKEVIRDLILQVVALPFLYELEPADIRVEVEFVFERPPNFIKGFIDLVFRQGHKLYLLDWKSNWLGESEESYSQEALELCMKAHDYELQASLYAEALQKAFGHLEFGGAYYLFLRGIKSPTQGVLFFQPRRDYAALA